MTLNLNNLTAVLQAKIDALTGTAEYKELLLLTKALEAVAGRASVSDVLIAGAEQGVEIDIRAAEKIDAINAAADAKLAAIAAAFLHTHAIADVTGLRDELDNILSSMATRGKQTVWIPAGAMVARTTNGAGPGSTESGTNRVMRRTMDFDPVVQEYAQFTVAMPHSWDRGTVTFQALWSAWNGAGGGVAWGLQAVAVGDGDSLDPAFGAGQVVTDNYIAVGVLHQTTESAAVTISGSPSDMDTVIFQIYRDVSNPVDTSGYDASLLGIRLFYKTNLSNDG